MIGLIGKKKGMTQIFEDNGVVVPVTVVETTPCTVLQIRTIEKDGYSAVQVGTGKKRKLPLPLKGHIKKAKLDTTMTIFEFRVLDTGNYKIGQKLDSSLFQEGEVIDVTGLSKGKGFQGVIKRHGFSRGPETHGSNSHRAPGSIGASATPARVVKGKKLPGRMGGERTTIKNLKIVKIEKEKKEIAIEGAIPGSRNNIVILRKKVLKGKGS